MLFAKDHVYCALCGWVGCPQELLHSDFDSFCPTCHGDPDEIHIVWSKTTWKFRRVFNKRARFITRYKMGFLFNHIHLIQFLKRRYSFVSFPNFYKSRWWI